MSDNVVETGRAALAAALARAGKRASTAAAVAAMVPLAMVAATPASAGSLICTTVCVTGSVTPNGDVSNYTYTFTNAGPHAVTLLELPELQPGEFLTEVATTAPAGMFATSPTHNINPFLGSISLAGWDVTENTTSEFGSGAPTFKAPNAGVGPGAYIDISFLGGEGSQALGSGGTMTLILESNSAASIGANMAVLLNGGGGTLSIDPPTPGSVPEPGSLALLGSAIAGVLGLRRRKKA